MKAFPNNDKQMYLDRIKKHREAGELVRDIVWDGTKGDSLGCTVHSDAQTKYARLLGIPIQLVFLQNWLFNNLPEGHLEYPEKFLNVVTQGLDLSEVSDKWAVRTLGRQVLSLTSIDSDFKTEVLASVLNVIKALSGLILSSVGLKEVYGEARDTFLKAAQRVNKTHWNFLNLKVGTRAEVVQEIKMCVASLAALDATYATWNGNIYEESANRRLKLLAKGTSVGTYSDLREIPELKQSCDVEIKQQAQDLIELIEECVLA